MSIKRVNQLLWLILVLIVVGSAVGVYFANKHLTSIAHNTSRQRAEIRIIDSRRKLANQASVKMESLSYVNDLLNKALPEDAQQSTLIAEISEFALRNRIPVEEISFDETSKAVSAKTGSKKSTTPAGVSVIPVAIKLKDGIEYNSLLNFLKTLESNRRKTQITNLSLTPDSKDRAKLNQVSIGMNVYARNKTKAQK